jgi:cardiolipin synthase
VDARGLLSGAARENWQEAGARLVLVGSINFDALSFRWLEEGSLLVDDPKLGAKAAAVFERDLKQAVEVGRRDAR